MNNSTEHENMSSVIDLDSLRATWSRKEYLFPDHGGQAHIFHKNIFDTRRWIDFSASINPLGPSRKIDQISKKSISTISQYPDPHSSELKQALGSYLKTDASRIVVTNGATELIYLLPHLIKRGQEVLILVPFFSEYQRAFKLSKVPVRTLPYDAANGFKPSIEKLLDFINANPNIGAVVIGHPNSPTGRLWDKEALSLLAKACEEQGKLLIIDESYIEFCTPGHSVLEWTEIFPHLIVIRSMTKLFALPGLRLGYGVMNEKWIQIIENFRPPWSVNSMAQAFGLASLNDKTFIESSRSFVREQRIFLIKHLLNTPGLKVYPSDTNFILFQLRGRQKDLPKIF